MKTLGHAKAEELTLLAARSDWMYVWSGAIWLKQQWSASVGPCTVICKAA